MENIKQDILTTKKLFSEISSEINLLNDDNFDSKIENINSIIESVTVKKKQLRDKLPENEYNYYCDLVHKGVKEISTIVDSIIEDKKQSLDSITEELSKTVNQKKIIKYQR
jgi:archaellum component FlaC